MRVIAMPQENLVNLRRLVLILLYYEADPAKSGAVRKYFIISNRCYLILFFFFGCFPCSPE